MKCEGTGFCDSLSGLVSLPRGHVVLLPDGGRLSVPEACSSGDEERLTFRPSLYVYHMSIANWDPEKSHTKF